MVDSTSPNPGKAYKLTAVQQEQSEPEEVSDKVDSQQRQLLADLYKLDTSRFVEELSNLTSSKKKILAQMSNEQEEEEEEVEHDVRNDCYYTQEEMQQA